MSNSIKLSKDKSKHVTDEIINASSHMIAAIFSLLGVSLLLVKASLLSDPWKIVSFSIYGLSLFLLFLFSTLHHGVNSSEKGDAFLRKMDYIFVFPLIAATYTPVCLVLLRNPIGWTVFGVIWTLAIIGIVLTAIFENLPKWTSNTLYICMGWVGVFVIITIISKIGILGLVLFLLGGISYSIGFIIYNIEKPNPIPGKFGFHELWHLLVISGALLHFFAMYFIVLQS